MFRTFTLLSLACALFIAGCIQVEKKEYRYTLKPDGTGTGTIRFVNIVSQEDNDKDVSFKDYAELVTDYMDGTKFEDENPTLKVTGKKLYEEKGVLVGEFNFTFASLDSVGFFRAANCACCPVLHFAKSSSSTGGGETIASTNGQLVEGVTDAPFIKWDSGAKEFTYAATLGIDTAKTHSLLPHYKKWKDKK
jgi:hypothetical protein